MDRLFPLGRHVICQEDCYSTCYTIFFDRISSLWAPLSHDKSTMRKEKIEGHVALPHWTVLMYSCPNTSRFPVGVTLTGIPKLSSTGAYLKILLSCLLKINHNTF